MVWSREKAEWYSRAIKCSDYPSAVMSVLDPLLSQCSTALDVGAGCGAMAIPMAARLEQVSVLEPSDAMMEVLRQEAKAALIDNMVYLQGRWGEVDVKSHDLVLCANVPGLTDDPLNVAIPMAAKAEKFIVFVLGAGKWRDKFYFKDLYPLLLDRQYLPRRDYMETYAGLHEQGIFADVQIIEYNLDQPFDDMDEAVACIKSYLPAFPGEKDGLLRGYLERKLERRGDKLWAPIPKKSAVIWWSPR